TTRAAKARLVRKRCSRPISTQPSTHERVFLNWRGHSKPPLLCQPRLRIGSGRNDWRKVAGRAAGHPTLTGLARRASEGIRTMKRSRVKAVGLGLALFAAELRALADDGRAEGTPPVAPKLLPVEMRPGDWSPLGTSSP